ncbi:hypothetical protein [Streptomyces sp. NPDC006285]|uniref:hypothetical protein n=1 Tax=Streptomyces sp. NPDC006285 TaxID=3364742 RepID=UPI0036A935D0
MHDRGAVGQALQQQPDLHVLAAGGVGFLLGLLPLPAARLERLSAVIAEQSGELVRSETTPRPLPSTRTRGYGPIRFFT